MKIITIHGIRKQQQWDLEFKGLSIWQNSDVEILNFDYGYFSIWKFINPFSRKKIYKKFQKFYSDNIGYKEQPPSLVCHSFGTKIFYYSIKKYNVIKFNKVILCGSILNQNTRFDKYFQNLQIRELINDYGSIDNVVKYSRLIMKDCGNSGQLGFLSVPEKYGKKFIQRENFFDHSDYFLNKNMSENWAQLLLPVKNFRYDKKILKRNIIERIYENIKRENKDDIEFTSLQYEARVDEKGNYYAKYTKRGINKANSTLPSYEVITTADSMNSIDEMQFIASGANDSTKLPVSYGDDSNQNKSFTIHFDSPINPNQDFTITYKFRWKDTIRIDNKIGDTDHFEIYNARNITIKVNFKFKLKSPRFFVIKRNTIISEQKAIQNKERDNTHSYSLDYANDENSDGIIFYFEGVEIQKSPYTQLSAFKLKKKNEECKIFKCSEEDIKPIYAIECKIEHGNAASEVTLKQRRSMFNDGFLVAKVQDKIIGYIESVLWDFGEFKEYEEIKNFPIHYNPNGKELYVIFIGVSEEYRGNGVAKHLLSEIEAIGRRYCIDKIRLVAKDNLTDLYKSLNYSHIIELPSFLKNRTYKSVLMERHLN